MILSGTAVQVSVHNDETRSRGGHYSNRNAWAPPKTGMQYIQCVMLCTFWWWKSWNSPIY